MLGTGMEGLYPSAPLAKSVPITVSVPPASVPPARSTFPTVPSIPGPTPTPTPAPALALVQPQTQARTPPQPQTQPKDGHVAQAVDVLELRTRVRKLEDALSEKDMSITELKRQLERARAENESQKLSLARLHTSLRDADEAKDMYASRVATLEQQAQHTRHNLLPVPVNLHQAALRDVFLGNVSDYFGDGMKEYPADCYGAEESKPSFLAFDLQPAVGTLGVLATRDLYSSTECRFDVAKDYAGDASEITSCIYETGCIEDADADAHAHAHTTNDVASRAGSETDTHTGTDTRTHTIAETVTDTDTDTSTRETDTDVQSDTEYAKDTDTYPDFETASPAGSVSGSGTDLYTDAHLDAYANADAGQLAEMEVEEEERELAQLAADDDEETVLVTAPQASRRVVFKKTQGGASKTTPGLCTEPLELVDASVLTRVRGMNAREVSRLSVPELTKLLNALGKAYVKPKATAVELLIATAKER